MVCFAIIVLVLYLIICSRANKEDEQVQYSRKRCFSRIGDGLVKMFDFATNNKLTESPNLISKNKSHHHVVTSLRNISWPF